MCFNAARKIYRSKVNLIDTPHWNKKKHVVKKCSSKITLQFIYRFYSSLKKKCAVSVNKKLIDWIKVQRPGPFELNANQPTTNVFIADFIELNNFQFCRAVVELNDKIFKELLFECSSDKHNDKDDKGNENKNENDNENGTPDLNHMLSDHNCIESNIADIQS